MSSDKNIVFNIDVNSIVLPIDCVTSLGLILKELLINSLKCTFNDKDGEIFLKLERNFPNKYQFIYKDNGIDVKTTSFSSYRNKISKIVVRINGC